jgi:hypothetical protein
MYEQRHLTKQTNISVTKSRANPRHGLHHGLDWNKSSHRTHAHTNDFSLLHENRSSRTSSKHFNSFPQKSYHPPTQRVRGYWIKRTRRDRRDGTDEMGWTRRDGRDEMDTGQDEMDRMRRNGEDGMERTGWRGGHGRKG